jgi:hypothetical protein
MLEKRMVEYRKVLPLLQRIQCMRIGIDKLLVFSVAVNEKAPEVVLELQSVLHIC